MKSPWMPRLLSGVGLAVATIGLTVLYFALLVAELYWYPQATGKTFQIDWPRVLSAFAPVIILVLLLLVTRFSTIRASWGNKAVEFTRQLPHLDTNGEELDAELVHKASARELSRLTDRIRQGTEGPHTLVVPLRSDLIRFDTLRDYIFEIRRVAPLQYVVFLDASEPQRGSDARRPYLGFLEVQRFVERYPRLALELTVEDADLLARETTQGVPNDLRPTFRNLEATREYARASVLQRYWRDETRAVTTSNFTALGASTFAVPPNDTNNVYRLLLANHLSGAPVVDRGRFLGMVTKSGIEGALLSTLLTS